MVASCWYLGGEDIVGGDVGVVCKVDGSLEGVYRWLLQVCR